MTERKTRKITEIKLRMLVTERERERKITINSYHYPTSHCLLLCIKREKERGRDG